MAYRVARLAWLGGALALSTACSQTTRVGDTTSEAQLAQTGKAVAVMRLGMASPSCQHVGVWLGTREGPGYRPQKPMAVIHAASLADVPVAEVELTPGEYHVISYACGTGSNTSQVASYDRTTGLARTSYASFTLAAGEVVNVGSFEFHASRVGRNAFGRPFRTTVSVKDWPLADLEKYKAKRPHIYAQMKTRLMTLTPRGAEEAGEDDCDRLRQLKSEGKVQNVPAGCEAAAKIAGKSGPKDR
jgi:hypothetical protein